LTDVTSEQVFPCVHELYVSSNFQLDWNSSCTLGTHEVSLQSVATCASSNFQLDQNSFCKRHKSTISLSCVRPCVSSNFQLD
jgi:hypothetical protein